MVVVDHDSGRLVWAAAGHDKATLQQFFDVLGPERASRIKLISADTAERIGDVALAACEHATLCLDPFHIVRWGSQALDVVRRLVWNLLRRMDLPGHAKQLKNCRYALWKNPEDLTAPPSRQAQRPATTRCPPFSPGRSTPTPPNKSRSRSLAWGTASWPAYRDVCEQLGQLLARADVISIVGGDHLYPSGTHRVRCPRR